MKEAITMSEQQPFTAGDEVDVWVSGVFQYRGVIAAYRPDRDLWTVREPAFGTMTDYLPSELRPARTGACTDKGCPVRGAHAHGPAGISQVHALAGDGCAGDSCDGQCTTAEVAFGTGGELAGEIFVYTLPAHLVRAGMTEREAAQAACLVGGILDDVSPEICTYAPRGRSQCRVLPLAIPVWTGDGNLIERDPATGEPYDYGDCPVHGHERITGTRAYTGFAGGSCWWWQFACGKQQVDESDDVEAAR